MQGNVSDSPEAGPASSARFHSAVAPESLIHWLRATRRSTLTQTYRQPYVLFPQVPVRKRSRHNTNLKQGGAALAQTYKYVAGCPTWRKNMAFQPTAPSITASFFILSPVFIDTFLHCKLTIIG